MKAIVKPQLQAQPGEAKFGKRQSPGMQEQDRAVSGRWSVVRRVRLPHKPGLPLGSDGGSDTIER